MPVVKQIGNAMLWTDDVQGECADQIKRTAALHFVDGHVAVMPDAHLGKGACIGTVIPTRAAIIPAAVGVDIGCGMVAAKTSLKASNLPDGLRRARSAIEAAVPVGHGRHVTTKMKGKGTPSRLRQAAAKDQRLAETLPKDWDLHIGSLGGGNHFIELSLDVDTDDVWIVLHSGSRGPGNRIGQRWIAVAKREMAALGVNLPDKELAYLTQGTDSFDGYWSALTWAQDFARLNRDVMFDLVTQALDGPLPPFQLSGKAVNCHHNYAVALREDGVATQNLRKAGGHGRVRFLTRKGAISAAKGELGVIPGSMGAHTYIVSGKGEELSYASCSHGAGRRMSRSRAKKAFRVDDLKAQTAGVECRKDVGVVDEIPGAYKSIEDVMAKQDDLVNVVAKLRPVLSVKG